MKKTLLAMSVATALLTSAATFAGGLTLSSHNAAKDILVFCGQNGTSYQGLMPIPANGSLPSLPWSVIALMFHGTPTSGIINLKCTFKLNQAPLATAPVVGTADLNIKADYSAGEVSNAQEFLSYGATISPSQGTFNPSMSVALQGPAN